MLSFNPSSLAGTKQPAPWTQTFGAIVGDHAMLLKAAMKMEGFDRLRLQVTTDETFDFLHPFSSSDNGKKRYCLPSNKVVTLLGKPQCPSYALDTYVPLSRRSDLWQQSQFDRVQAVRGQGKKEFFILRDNVFNSTSLTAPSEKQLEALQQSGVLNLLT